MFFRVCHLPILRGAAAPLILACSGAFGQGAPAHRVLVELHAPPVAQVYAAHRAAPEKAAVAARAARDAVFQEQAALRSGFAAKALAVRELFAVQLGANAVALHVPDASLGALRAMPEVKRVVPLRRFTLEVATSVPFVGAPAFWEAQPEGLTGRGIRVGVVDTGIDYLHADFGGQGDSADHAANDTTRIDDGFFPTVRVVGGYDFVGERYDPLDEENDVPEPDPDPMDQNGHGTHVAGILGGNGIRQDGVAFAGPYGSDAIAGLKLGPGMAPEVEFYALKIFSASLQSDVLLPAIDWAMDPNGDGDLSDRLDVLNLSLGEPFGPADAVEAEACNRAAQAGVVVVASAGNNGDTYYITSMPAASPWVISVAACEDEDPGETGLDAFQLSSFSSRGPSHSHGGRVWLKPDVTAPGSRIRSAGAFVVSGAEPVRLLSGTSMACPHVAGLASLLRQQDPQLTAPQVKALIMNTASRDVFLDPDQALPRNGPAQAGVGAVDGAHASRNSVILFGTAHPEAVHVTFQAREVVDVLHETESITVSNLGTEARSFSVGLDPVVTIPGVSVAIAPDFLSLGAGESAALTLTLDAEAEMMKHVRDPAAAARTANVLRHWISEAVGYVALTDMADGETLRLGYYAALRPASDVRATDTAVQVDADGNGALHFEGSSFAHGSSLPDDETASRSVYKWLHSDAQDAARTGLEAGADIAQVGVAFTPFDGAEAEQELAVGIAVHGDWFTPNYVQFSVEIDLDADGVADRVLYSSSDQTAAGTGVPFRDVYSSRLRNGSADAIVGNLNQLAPDSYNTALFHSNVLFLTAPLTALGLEDSGFRMRVQTFLLPGVVFPPALELMDETPWLEVDRARHLIVEVEGLIAGPLGVDDVAQPMVLRIDRAVAATLEAPKLLVLHHHNTAARRAEVIDVILADDAPKPGFPVCGVSEQAGFRISDVVCLLVLLGVLGVAGWRRVL
ncbi:MAG: S8 family serine peptidase [Candidatus Hydrogenedentes bacterium]|nr:S8 family serine peptidase [Candidatus Hydrogenedentota bacterium]